MTITAAQVREARALLGWTSPILTRRAGVGFVTALKAQDDEGIAAVNWLDLQAIREAFERGGVEFGQDGELRSHRVAVTRIRDTTVAVLAWLAQHEPATVVEIAQGCCVERARMRGRLIMLERQGLIAGESHGAASRRQRIYRVTAEGRRAAGMSEASAIEE